jgi:hypothetical protein
MNDEDIGARMRRFALSKYGSLRQFAADLEMSASSLNTSYLSGRSMPGGKVLRRLILMGCDINWLLSGLGRAPKPTLQEMIKWRDYCKQQYEYWDKMIEARNLMPKELEYAPVDHVKQKAAIAKEEAKEAAEAAKHKPAKKGKKK